jgi:hypothetical protein
MDGSAALSLYRQEKERALQERRISHAQLMAEAKEAFAKMLADAQLARKGGRPKSNPNAPPSPASVAAAAKPKVVEAAPPAKKAAPVKAAAPAKKAEVAVAKPKAAPVKKAAAKKVRVAAKRAQPSRVKAAAGMKKPAKKAAPARAARPATQRKPAKKR